MLLKLEPLHQKEVKYINEYVCVRRLVLKKTTDIRLSKDNEIVMMHDLKLDRTTDGTGLIRDHDYFGYIDGLKTKAEPHVPIPRFNDVLDLLTNPDTSSDLYMIVDIKVHEIIFSIQLNFFAKNIFQFDTPIEILDVLEKLLNQYSETYPQLHKQLIFGIWDLKYLKKATELFASKYRLCFIGLSISGARTHFLDTVDCVSLPFDALASSDGEEFIKEVHERNKKVFTWTINDPSQMKTCVLWQVDGVIGDNVTLILENVHTIPKAILTQEEYQTYKDSDTYLASKRTRLYYYLRSKLMSFASSRWIGV